MTQHHKRRNYFINKELQGRMILAVFLLSIIGVGFFTVIFSLVSTDHMTISYTDQTFRVGATPEVLIKELLTANWLFILLGGGIISVVMLFVSHIFAGPLYRFESVFKIMNQRDLSQHIRLRKRDVGKSLAVEINHFNRLYSADLQALQHLSESLAGRLKHKDIEQAEQGLAEIIEIISRYKIKKEV